MITIVLVKQFSTTKDKLWEKFCNKLPAAGENFRKITDISQKLLFFGVILKNIWFWTKIMKNNENMPFFKKQVRLAMVPRNNQLILFETSIQHQEFLMTKTKLSPSIQIYKELKNRILQHLAKFHQNLMACSEGIRTNTS